VVDDRLVVRCLVSDFCFSVVVTQRSVGFLVANGGLIPSVLGCDVSIMMGIEVYLGVSVRGLFVVAYFPVLLRHESD